MLPCAAELRTILWWNDWPQAHGFRRAFGGALARLGDSGLGFRARTWILVSPFPLALTLITVVKN